MSAKSDENQVIDEPSWPHCIYGEAVSVICGRLSQNKKYTKGRQNVLCMCSGRFQIRVYTYCHKLYNHRKQGWSAAGSHTLYILQCDFLKMVRGSMSRKRKLFHDKPMTTVNSYFVKDVVLDWAGNKDIGIIGTNARNRLPKDNKPIYLHEEKTNVTMKNSKDAKFFEPIVAVKNYSRGL